MIIIGNDNIEEIFGSKVTIAVLRPLMFRRICLVRLKKYGGKDQRAPNNSGIKYGIIFPRNAKEAVQFDKENGNLLWQNELLKKLENRMSMKAFEELPSSLRNAGTKGFQFAPLRTIFDVKVDLRRKSRLVIGGHDVDYSGHHFYASTMESVSARILMTIAAATHLYVVMGNIGIDYLNVNTGEKIYTHASPDFEVVGIMAEGCLLEVIKALNGLPTSGNRWHAHLLHTWREIDFNPTRSNLDVWIRGCKAGYDYIGTHTDDVLVVAI